MQTARKGSTAALLAAAVLGALAPAPAGQEAGPEPSCPVPVLRNGGFEEPPSPGVGGIPWWIVLGRGRARLVDEAGSTALALEGSVTVQQPVPAYAPWVDRVVLRGRMRGKGALSIAGGVVLERELTLPGDELRPFELVLARSPGVVPRLLLQLHGAEEDGVPLPSVWDDLEVVAPMPCPSEEALRAEVLGHLTTFFDTVLAVTLDDVNVPTPLQVRDFDARTGEGLGPLRPRGGDRDVVFHELLLRAWRVEPRPEWEQALVRFGRAYLDLLVHPETGLPRRWDPVRDEPLDEVFLEVHRDLRLLVDLARHGPEPLRAPMRAAAERAARTLLGRAVMPDGEVAGKLRPADAEPTFDVPHLRRLDAPARLASIGALTDDAELGRACRLAAEEAVLTLLYDHFWPGTWERIDPGFDDNFGHYGARATTMWRAFPEDPVFRALAMSGYERYAPLWRDALRYGGNVATDQVRCWRIFEEIAELEPAVRDEVAALLEAAAAAHFQGEQVADGAWIDTTVLGFHPVELPVGDVGGLPQNLLEGLAVVYDDELGLRTDAMRARFTAVLRTTAERHGYAFGPSVDAPADGPAPGFVDGARLATGLVEMLEALER